MMRSSFLRCAAVAFCAVAVLTGCGEQEKKAASGADKPKAEPAAQAQARTVYGSAMEKAKSTDCLMQMRNLHGFWAAEEYLPTLASGFAGAGSALKCPGSGADYEFLVSGRVRNAGKVPVLRCPTHNLVLYSDGSASAGR
ncbi:MAG: hypothetical protein J6Y54_09720 [Lentisphaeria bacterium]|nr:hypothetical protein [Lentisphaeria bacterium]